MTSIEMRSNQLFLRNEYPSSGKWEFPIIRKQEIDLSDIRLIACSDTRSNDCLQNTQCGVHHFVDDYRFESVYNNPKNSLKKYSQYKFLITPEFSTYADMNIWRQIENTGKNRWVGAYWQSKGLSVIPAICWSTPKSYEFCFDSIEQNSIVSVGMIGSKKEKRNFLCGYNMMLERIQPKAIIVFGTPFDEMRGNIITVDYLASRKVVR